MSAAKLVIIGILLFISIATAYLTLFEYKEDGNGNHGWHFRYSQQK